MLNDPRLVLVLETEGEAVLDGQQKSSHAFAFQRDLEQGRLVEFMVDDRVRLVVQAVDVPVDVDGVLVSAIAEGAAVVVGLDGIDTLVAADGMTLKGVDDVFLVRLEAAHDGLDEVESRHGHSTGEGA